MEDYDENVFEDVLSDLGIKKSGSYSGDGVYTVTLSNSNEFGKISSILDNSGKVRQIEDSSYLTPDNGNLDYRYGDDFILSLVADFDNDYYQLVITNMGE